MPYKDTEIRLAKMRAAYLRRKKADPEKIRATGRAAMKRYRERKKGLLPPPVKKRPEMLFRANLSKYGITVQQYEDMAIKQRGVCAICQKKETCKYRGRPRRLSVDHRHSDGKVRALLCTCCNRAIGLMKEDPRLFLLAAGYLRRHA